MCPCRHTTRHQFSNEVLNTLRNEFEIVLGQFGTDIPGAQQMQANRNNNLQARDSMMAQVPTMGNMNIMENSEERMRRLERENEEIRARLLTLQAAMQKPDNSNNTGINPGQSIQSYNNVLTSFFGNDSNFNEPNTDLMHRGGVMARQQQQQVRIFFFCDQL